MERRNSSLRPRRRIPEHTTAPIPEGEMEAQTNGVEEEPSATLADLSPEALQEQLMQQCRKTEEYLDHLQRLQADFNNYRRRANQDKLLATSRGKEDVLRALLPVLANFRLALQHAQEDANAVRQGVQMIWQQFEGFLRDQGVERIETVGQPFDPAQHEALSTAPATAELPPIRLSLKSMRATCSMDACCARPRWSWRTTEETSATAEMTRRHGHRLILRHELQATGGKVSQLPVSPQRPLPLMCAGPPSTAGKVRITSCRHVRRRAMLSSALAGISPRDTWAMNSCRDVVIKSVALISS